jgi:hypothetical protein
MIWANLLHLSFNMWEDWDAPGHTFRSYRPELRFDDSLWHELIARMTDAGMNMVVIDLGDGVRYETHPEIAVQQAWSVGRLREEIARLRSAGLEPIPKLNFATTHDAWLGPYSRCVSTPEYYRVCNDLITEVAAIFDTPRFFHLGMDEENAHHQRDYRYVVIRQFDLYWHDFHFLRQAVERTGARPWIWSDYVWRHQDEFLRQVPTSVLQSNWYYDTRFDQEAPDKRMAPDAYVTLDTFGYDQIPTASSFSSPDNFRLTVDYCRRLAPNRLFGFLQTPWRPTINEFRAQHLAAIEQVQDVIR